MILFIENMRGHRNHYTIASESDLNEVFNLFPQTRQIFDRSESLKSAVLRISRYLNSHNLRSWTEDHKSEDFSKSLKAKAAVAGLALASLLPSVTDSSSFKEADPLAFEQKSIKEPSFGKMPEDKFLWTIREIESTGGINTKHKMITSGPMKGQVAMGSWGLLHPTVKEMVERMKLDGSAKDKDKKLLSMSRDEMDNYFKQNPSHELRITRYLARHVIKKQKGDLHRAAYSWLYGHNINRSAITEHKLKDDYVQKFKKFNQNNPFNKQPSFVRALSSVDDSSTVKMIKSKIDFKTKVKEWQKYRDNLMATPTTTSSYNPDSGRIRDKDLDRKAPDKTNFIEYLKFKIDNL